MLGSIELPTRNVLVPFKLDIDNKAEMINVTKYIQLLIESDDIIL